ASSIARRIDSESFRTGFHTILAGTSADASSACATSVDCCATWRSVSSPYRSWLPVKNQISCVLYALAMMSLLSVDVLVALVERVDMLLVDRDRVAQLARDVHGSRHFLAHHRGFDCGLGVLSDSERTVVAHQHGRAAGLAQRGHDAAANRIIANDGEGAYRDRAAEFVGHHGQHAGNFLAARRPCGGVGGVG